MLPPDTIFAPATGYGRTAVAVVRISGPQAGPALAALIRASLPSARRLSLRTLREPGTGELLDHALVAWLPGPGTATGEDMVELHLHGGPAVRAAVLRSLAALPGLVPAEAGAFTRRAFLNGRMDLTAVEGLTDLIDAETEAQRRQAVRQLDGVLGRAVERWRETLLDVLAGTEAALDFSDEGDVDDDALTASGRVAAE
ncbi:tRNA modification GTPase MnmE, partial [Methylobacterium indicum]